MCGRGVWQLVFTPHLERRGQLWGCLSLELVRCCWCGAAALRVVVWWCCTVGFGVVWHCGCGVREGAWQQKQEEGNVR